MVKRDVSKLLYSEGYYAERHEKTLKAAERVLRIVRSIFARPIRSAVDVGCGVGTRLFVTGCKDILGFDGEWVPAEHVRIPTEKLVRCNNSLGVALPLSWSHPAMSFRLESVPGRLSRAARGGGRSSPWAVPDRQPLASSQTSLHAGTTGSAVSGHHRTSRSPRMCTSILIPTIRTI